MDARIDHNRITGTRVTVWDVLHYLEHGWTPENTADVLKISEEQVRVAMQYIDEHRDEVMAVHQQLEDRNARGNPPEVEAKLAMSRAKLEAWRKEREQNASGNRR